MGHPNYSNGACAQVQLEERVERQASTTQRDVNVQEREGLMHKVFLYGNLKGDYPLIVRVFFWLPL